MSRHPCSMLVRSDVWSRACLDPQQQLARASPRPWHGFAAPPLSTPLGIPSTLHATRHPAPAHMCGGVSDAQLFVQTHGGGTVRKRQTRGLELVAQRLGEGRGGGGRLCAGENGGNGQCEGWYGLNAGWGKQGMQA